MGVVDLVIQVETPKSVARACSASGARPHAGLGLEGADLPEVPRGSPRVGGRRGAMRAGRSRRRAYRATRSTCSRSRSSRSAQTRRCRSTSSTSSRAGRIRSPTSRLRSRTSSTCSPDATRRTISPSCAHGCIGIARRRRPRANRRAAARGHERGDDSRSGLFGVFLADGGGRVGELDEEMVYEAREGQTFLLGRRPGGSRR